MHEDIYILWTSATIHSSYVLLVCRCKQASFSTDSCT